MARRQVRLPVGAPPTWDAASMDECRRRLQEQFETTEGHMGKPVETGRISRPTTIPAEAAARIEAEGERAMRLGHMARVHDLLQEYFAPPPAAAETVRVTLERPADPRGQTRATEEARAIIERATERSLATLRQLAEHGGSERVRDQARRDLARYEWRLAR
jgi:hypothetical protein